MAQHTPGPWLVDPNEEYVAVIANTEDGEGIAEVGERTPVNLANARLIAAAPEMLEALRGVESVLGASFRHLSVIQAARAAIAKAEGQG